MSLLSPADCKRIEEAIARVESQSAAEFVVAVVPRSAPYAEWRALVAAVWAVLAALAYLQWGPWGTEIWGLLGQIPIGLSIWALAGIPELHRWIIPKGDAEKAVQATAFRLFAERGVHRTRDRTGMLLLISELEHQAVLLGDRGIDERVGGPSHWQEHVDFLIRRIKEGRAADGVVEVIDRLAATLRADVPIQEGDRNELPNRVIQDG